MHQFSWVRFLLNESYKPVKKENDVSKFNIIWLMISGIGKETALALSRLGAKVIIGSRNVDKSKKVAQEIQDETGSQVELLTVHNTYLFSYAAADIS